MLFLGIIGLCLGLTFFAGWRRYLPSSMAGAVAWLGLGVLWLLSPATIGIDSTEQWTQYFGYVFVLLAIVPVMLYIKPLTTMHTEKTIKDGMGRVVGSKSWTEDRYGKPRGNAREQSKMRQAAYKAQLRERWGSQKGR